MSRSQSTPLPALDCHITHGDEGLNGRLMYSGTWDASVKFPPVAGMVMQLTEKGTFKTGVHAHLPAMFVMNSSCIPSPLEISDCAVDRFKKKAAAPTHKISLCVGSRSYVFESSWFVDAKYDFGDLLTAISDDKNSSLGGKLTNAGSGKDRKVKVLTDPVIGALTKKPFLNHNQIKTIELITGWLPGKIKKKF